MKKMRVTAQRPPNALGDFDTSGKNYTISLAEDPETYEWRATLSIPEAHVHEEGSGDYGWEALANLADRMKRMGLLD
jgi:hypothetical protein